MTPDPMINKLLLVEDNPGDQRLIAEILGETSFDEYSLSQVSTLAEALVVLSNERVDLVLLDLHLPDGQGLETLQTIRIEASHAPIVVLTGLDDEAIGAQTIREGAQDYLVKSELTGPILLRTIRYALERHQLQSMIFKQSVTDVLTGLTNRRGFMYLAEQQLRSASRNTQDQLLLMLDMDELKAINDNHGHRMGDQALIEISGLLRFTFRQSDIIARLGGDEFVVLAGNSIDSTSILTRLEHNIKNFNLNNERPYILSVSVGSAIWTEKDQTPLEVLMNEADRSLYQIKSLRSQSGPKLIS
jgi:two-component system, cell cycle response regulator